GASALASAAHRRRAMQVPDPHAEAEFLFSERADRANVHDVAGILVVDRLAGIDVDAVVIAALENRELRRLGNLVEEARTSRAQDATLLVEHHARSDIDRLALVIFLRQRKARRL